MLVLLKLNRWVWLKLKLTLKGVHDKTDITVFYAQPQAIAEWANIVNFRPKLPFKGNLHFNKKITLNHRK